MGSKNADILLIQHYLEGKMSPGEMHELERQALDDPFLSDALEGYSRNGKVSSQQLSILQRQLEGRIALQLENKNTFYFSWQRLSVAAAAGLLFVSAGILFWMKQANLNARQHNKSRVEVTLDPSLQNRVRTTPAPPSAPPPAPKEEVAIAAVSQVGRQNSQKTKLAPYQKGVPLAIAAADDTTSTIGDLITEKENSKADFQDFVGGLPQGKKDLVILKDSSNVKGTSGTDLGPVAKKTERVEIREGVEQGRLRVSSVTEYRDFLGSRLYSLAQARKFYSKLKINFAIEPDGSISDVVVSGAPDKDFELEIQRIMKDGPIFKVKEGAKKDKKSITLQYKAPKTQP